MTEKSDILAYLAEVQRMQMEAEKVEMTITCYPDLCGFGVMLADLANDNIFYVLRARSEEDNKRAMERLREEYNQLNAKTLNE